MKVRSLTPLQLPISLRDQWVAHLETNPDISSPYFRPEFTEAVARARADTYVAVIDDGEAFLPFHREALQFGRPVGFLLSDYQGLIAPIDYELDAMQLVRGMDLAAWEFNHLPASQASFLPWAEARWESPQVDIAVWKRDPPKLSAENRKKRKLAREVGPLEFDFDCSNKEVFWQCMTWKSEQHARTETRDIMQLSWVAPLLTDILASKNREFAGILSVLRSGGRVVAAHFGIRSGGVLHYWFPSYDIELGSYSPGMILLLEMLNAASGHGIHTVDLGRGSSLYKTRVATTAVPLIEGGVAPKAWARTLRRSRRTITDWVRNSPFREPLRAILRKTPPVMFLG